MQHTVVVVLGAPNDDHGSLSWISLDRCHEALRQYRARRGSLLLPVGGWGDHFNRTALPHWRYVRDFFLREGVPSSDILDGVESSNTREDAVLTRERLEQLDVRHAIVVTSDFHAERAARQFKAVARNIGYEFAAAPSSGPPTEIEHLREHETQALARLREEAS